MSPLTRLLVGPVLRHVGTTDATVWVETDAPCEVRGRSARRERTWKVERAPLRARHGRRADAGHGHRVRRAPRRRLGVAAARASRARRRASAPCRRRQRRGRPRASPSVPAATPRRRDTRRDRHFDADALAAYARELAAQDEADWPDALLMLGDQVYADETTEPTRRRIRAKRDITARRKDQVADFEEYTWLYLESWTDPDVRWLLSTCPAR